MSLAPLSLPTEPAAWTGWLDDRARGSLRVAADQVAALKAAPAQDLAILRSWNDAAISVANASAICGLLSSVHPDAAVIELAEEIEVEVRRFANELLLDREVFDQLSSLAEDALDDGARRVLRDALRDFRRAGVDRDETTRARMRELNERETELSQGFSRNIRDGRRTARVPASALAGLPEDFVAEHPADDAGLVAITTEYPDVHPFLTYSADAEARRAVAMEYFNLAWPENDQVLGDLLRLRQEKAQLVGYADWPDFDAEVKMIGKGAAIGEFIERIAADSVDAGRRELAILAERGARDGIATIDLSNWRYCFEAVKREQHGVDAQEVRRYFDFAKVHQGLLDVTGRLFGLTYVPVDAPTWHADVTSYDVHLDGGLLGRIHLDLHPRDRKYNHAAQFDLVPGVRDRQLPEGVLVCNFPRGLMDHDEVVTLFHEFGHLMHHVLAGRHEWVRFSGVATEWDFVEAPSQMLEEWAWDAGVLQVFATDADGNAIPTDLVERMRAADEFGKGFLTRTQMLYAAISYRFHLEVPDDLTARLFELYPEYSLITPLAGTHFHAGFGHLDGYTSAYYTYAWSLVIAKDLFSAFDPDDLFDPERARRYRDTILAAGGSKDAATLVEEFLGRPYDTEAFTTWLNR
ncbi:peptidase M3 [Nocardioides marmoriginsengisoli]|uniref:Peptidase M3 n=1 Tax=Nocardioides marmoriginsengisoli TaxID=661483 RepID=A0A3N0CC54_9ACTN|nr:M3 family metallopeptidase [Nocardioides marmoriginsengisoli]RNL61022.1 peptidase M3 [Nocardioides marmoriginsengisoli]